MIRIGDGFLSTFAGLKGNLMKKIFLVMVMLCFCGCALRHTSEIGRLQEYGRNMDEQKSYVKAQDKKFEELLKVVKTDQMSKYTTQADFLKAFGEPIFVKDVSGKKDYAILWLYRYDEKLFGSEKVYLYFDSAGSLVAWEHVPAEKR